MPHIESLQNIIRPFVLFFILTDNLSRECRAIRPDLPSRIEAGADPEPGMVTDEGTHFSSATRYFFTFDKDKVFLRVVPIICCDREGTNIDILAQEQSEQHRRGAC
jgi:hypothetical protein